MTPCYFVNPEFCWLLIGRNCSRLIITAGSNIYCENFRASSHWRLISSMHRDLYRPVASWLWQQWVVSVCRTLNYLRILYYLQHTYLNQLTFNVSKSSSLSYAYSAWISVCGPRISLTDARQCAQLSGNRLAMTTGLNNRSLFVGFLRIADNSSLAVRI